MGIYIPGMEMPKNGCIKHLLLLRDGSVCSVIDVTSGCQPPPEEQNYIAIPVPPHGDLVDARFILAALKSSDFSTYADYATAFNALDFAETVIPTDKEDV